MVPAALGAVWVVLRDTAGAGDGEGADFADAVGEVFLSMTFGTRLFTLGLESGVSTVVPKPWVGSIKLRRFEGVIEKTLKNRETRRNRETSTLSVLLPVREPSAD